MCWRSVAALWLACSAFVACAAGIPGREGIVVTPEQEGLAGDADAASQGTVDEEQLEHRPLLRPGEVLEVIPGVVITQHSGSGKANQYFLRGINLDHGTDFAVHVDGMPVNLPSHGHGQGYADLNFLIPELIEHIHYRKGPYYAEEGDFSAAGAAHVHLKRALSGSAELSFGSHGYRRTLLAGSRDAGDGRLLGALELGAADGPWQEPERLRKANGVLRYSAGDDRNGSSLTAMAYAARWNATDQIPQRAVAGGQLGRFSAVDATDGGRASRYSLSAQWGRADDATATRLSAYAIRSTLDLFSNFTYFLADPVNGDQFEQVDRRTVGGADASHSWRTSFRDGREMEQVLGARVRRDDIGEVGLFNTAARTRLATVRRDAVVQTSASAYYSNSMRWTPWLRTLAGVRVDGYRFRVASDNALNSGAASASLFSPKFGAVFGPWQEVEYFLNAGYGFHSNDARGATITVDPAAPARAVQRVTPLVRAKGAELGARAAPLAGYQSSLALWRLDLASELVFAGDAGTTRASRPSRRIGIEWTNYLRLPRSITVDFDATLSRARFTDDDPVGNRVPGATDRTLSAGLTYAEGPWSGGLRLRHFGPRSLTEDGAQRSDATTLVNAKLGFAPRRSVRLGLEVLNLFNRPADDITYFYASRLPGEPAAGVQDKHFHPVEPRTLRLSLRVEL